MEWRLFADLADAAGSRRVAVDGEPATVGEALDALLEAHPVLRERVLDETGELEDHVNLLVNGAAVTDGGLDAPVKPGDELALFPPVSGGRRRSDRVVEG